MFVFCINVARNIFFLSFLKASCVSGPNVCTPWLLATRNKLLFYSDISRMMHLS